MSLDNTAPENSRLALTVMVAVALAVVVTIFRRPDQYSGPAVWSEELLVILTEWAETGWKSVLSDVNGTFPVPMRVLLTANLALFPLEWPLANAITAAVVTAITVGLIVGVPSTLRWRLAIAAFVLLMPTDAEVFGVGLYALWWLSIWSLIGVLWRSDAPGQPIRIALGWVGALASPVGAAFGLLGWVRYFSTRSRSDLAFSTWVTVPASMTLVAVLTTGRQLGDSPADFGNIAGLGYDVITRFFGFWVWSPQGFSGANVLHLVLGSLLIAVLVAGVLTARQNPTVLVLSAALAVSVGAVLIRVAPPIIHPIVAGPRYFFLTFALIAMILTQVLATLPRDPVASVIRTIGLVLVAVAAMNISALALFDGVNSRDLPETVGFRRHHVAYSWAEQLSSCAAGGEIQALQDGSGTMHSIVGPTDWCAEALSH